MTIQAVVREIKALPGMTAKYTPEYQEFRVRLVGKPEADYYTCDRDDALGTARAMSKEANKV